MKKVIDKLVRDNIPEIIKSEGLIPLFYYSTGNNLRLQMYDKLVEEVKELVEEIKSKTEINFPQLLASEDFSKSKLLEELADVCEVISSIIKIETIDLFELLNVVLKKKNEKGGFDKGIYLVSIE